MGVIRRLPDDIANQIAAGEVVERPASVVKELLENAVDAGATRVRVDVEGGGIARLCVTDDGCGMSGEDARLAVERHATSKLRGLDDLSILRSYGFRGEALPSIASVSRFALRTRRREDDAGTEVLVEGGTAKDARPCGLSAGTIIEVRDLFYNVPARRKFLRSLATESAHVTEVTQALSLACPELTVVLAREGRVVREWLRVSNFEERVLTTFRDETLSACRGERGPLKVEAFLAPPERGRAAAGSLLLYVNRRHVRDRTLLRAVAQAFGSVLEAGRYPLGVVYLELPPSLVDVNVHPQKAEVRFADGRAVSEALFRVLADELARAFGVPVAHRWGGYGSRPPAFPAVPLGDMPRPEEPSGAAWEWLTPQSPATSPPAPAFTPGALDPARDRAVVGHPYPLLAQPTLPERPAFSHLAFVAQVKQTYLVCEGPDGLYLLDQHAAAERVTFHRLRTAYAGREIATQSLLFPVSVQVTAADASFVEEEQDTLGRLGLDVRAIGPTTVAVHAIPRLLVRADPETVVRDLIAEASREGGRAFSGAVDLVLATMACHGSVRAGDRLSNEEANALLISLDQVDFSGHCPHGRPIVTRLGWDELERKVGRR
jgi:DNA mismatch repair protein MutL